MINCKTLNHFKKIYFTSGNSETRFYHAQVAVLIRYDNVNTIKIDCIVDRISNVDKYIILLVPLHLLCLYE